MFKNLFNQPKRVIATLGKITVLIILALLAYSYITFKTNLWMYYPGNQRFQAAFSRLQASCEDYPYQGMCKGECGLQRERYRLAIADYILKDNQNIAEDQVKKAILNNKNSTCFREELINAVYDVYQKRVQGRKINPPQYLIDYLNSSLSADSREAKIRNEIIKYFGESVFTDTLSKKLVEQANDPSIDCSIRDKAIEDLGFYGDEKISRPIFQKLIEENKDPDHLWVAYDAAQHLKAPKIKDRNFVNWCKNIISGNYSPYIKEEIVTTLSEYKNNVPEEKEYVINILKNIYSNKSLNVFIRNDASDILQYNLGKGSEKLYPNPKISDKEWDEYEANKPRFPDYCKNSV